MQVPSSRPSPYQIGFILGEAVLMTVGAVLAVYLRLGSLDELFGGQYTWQRLGLVPVVLQATFYYFDLHNFRVSRPFLWTAARVAQALAVGTLSLAMVYYLFPRMFLGRGILLMSYLVTLGLVLIWRAIYGWALNQSLFASRLILVGNGSLADAICEEIISRADNIYQIVCIVDTSAQVPAGVQGGEGSLNLAYGWARLMRADLRSESPHLSGLVTYYGASMVVVAMDEKRGRMPHEELLRCRMLGIPVIAGEDFYEQVAGRILADRIRPSWLIFSPGFQTSTMRRTTKRIMDMCLALVGLILSSPLAVLTALAVKLDSRGPLFYRQERVGQDGKCFSIMKFRSMQVDAEKDTGPVWAQENDDRVTRVGRFIRKTRLDEIPQMWNVLRGEMSFVGPRPERPVFVEQLTKELPFYEERHNVKPGITGWAQICYPYGSSVAAALEKLNYDLYYIKHSNLSLDVLILLQTIKILLFGGGGR